MGTYFFPVLFFPLFHLLFSCFVLFTAESHSVAQACFKLASVFLSVGSTTPGYFIVAAETLDHSAWVMAKNPHRSLPLEIQEKFNYLTCLGDSAMFMLFGVYGLEAQGNGGSCVVAWEL